MPRQSITLTEKSGHVLQSPQEMLDEFKSELKTKM